MKSYSQKHSIGIFLFSFALVFLMSTSPMHAQTSTAVSNETLTAAATAPVLFADVDDVKPAATTSTSAANLPDAPSAMIASLEPAAIPEQDPYNPKARPAGPHVAPIYTKYIPAGWTAQKLTVHDKIVLGTRDLFSPLTILGDIASAGYSDITDGQPNYGTNATALGKRVGATFLRDSTEGIFTDAVFAPLLHEDPRYYVQGPQRNFFERVVYAGTRTILTRTDSGRTSVNGAMLLGYASSSALSYTYYPVINQNAKDTALTFGGSLGGSAIGFLVSEFSDQVLQALHLEKKN